MAEIFTEARWVLFWPDLQYCADQWQYGSFGDGGHANGPNQPWWTWISSSVAGFNNWSIKLWLAVSCLPSFLLSLLFMPVNSSTAQSQTWYPFSCPVPSFFVALFACCSFCLSLFCNFSFPLTPSLVLACRLCRLSTDIPYCFAHCRSFFCQIFKKHFE